MVASRRTRFLESLKPQWTAAAFLAVTALLVSSSAAAEVLDKVAAPWNAYVLGQAAIVFMVCAAMAASPWPWVRIAAIGVALLWAVFRLSTEEWFSPDVGPALRVELSPAEGRAWLAVLSAEAVLPLVASVMLWIVRGRRWGSE